MTIVDVTKDNECCCSCTHNKRTFDIASILEAMKHD